MLVGYSLKISVYSRYIETNSGKTRGTSNFDLRPASFVLLMANIFLADENLGKMGVDTL
jgi:hypothetical protein